MCWWRWPLIYLDFSQYGCCIAPATVHVNYVIVACDVKQFIVIWFVELSYVLLFWLWQLISSWWCIWFTHACTCIRKCHCLSKLFHSLWSIVKQCTRLEHIDVAGNRSVTGQVSTACVYYVRCINSEVIVSWKKLNVQYQMLKLRWS